MTTKACMLNAFAELSFSGLTQPPAWKGKNEDETLTNKRRAIDAYVNATQRYTDQQLVDATRAYIASGSQFWPAVGQLIALMPRKAPPAQLALVSRDLEWCPMSFADKMPYELQIEMLTEYGNGPDGETDGVIWDRMNAFLIRRCGELGLDWEQIARGSQ